MLGGDGGALDQGQEIALYTLARHVGADAAFACADFVDLIKKHDTVILDRFDRFLCQLVGIEQLVGFLVNKDVVGIRYCDAPCFGSAAAEFAENIANRDCAHLRSRHARNVEQRQAAAAGLHFDLDFLVVKLGGPQFLAKCFFGGNARIGADQSVKHAIFSGLLRARVHILAFLFTRQGDSHFDQVAYDLFDVAADITHLGEFGRFNFQERRAGKFREASRNFGLADAGWADHQNVLRQHFFAQPLVKLQAAPAIAQRDRDRALGVGLPDDETVELGDDFTGREVGHAFNVSMVTLRLVYTQISAAISSERRTIASASSGPSSRARAAASA